MRRALRVDAVKLEESVRWLRVLRVLTATGHHLYPAWQLNDGAVVQGLQPVLETLRTGTEDEWSWALWLCSKVLERDGGDGTRRQVDELANGDIGTVLARAERMAEGWAA